VAAQAVRWAIDVAGVEYLESQDGALVFYDVNANSNLRPAVAEAFGIDPFERVLDYLLRTVLALNQRFGDQGLSAAIQPMQGK
jgi:hypothetical protein